MKGMVVIVGFGLIGGFIVFVIKVKYLEVYIIGIDVFYYLLEVGKFFGVIDEIGESILIDGLKVDLFVFCCLVKEIE